MQVASWEVLEGGVWNCSGQIRMKKVIFKGIPHTEKYMKRLQ